MVGVEAGAGAMEGAETVAGAGVREGGMKKGNSPGNAGYFASISVKHKATAVHIVL